MLTMLFALFVWMGLGIEGEAAPVPDVASRKLLIVVIDGVRMQELRDQARDDQGRVVKTATLMPVLSALIKQGTYYPELQISNPAGKSLPAYADLFAGRRQEKIVTNNPPEEDMRSHYPTLFEAASLGGIRSAVIAAWRPICGVVTQRGFKPGSGSIELSCGPEKTDLKGELYPGLRTDFDVYLRAVQDIRRDHPRLMFVHFGDADSEGHLHDTAAAKTGIEAGIYPYHAALTASDHWLGKLWEMVQADPFYKDQTYLWVVTDHGRDNVPTQDQFAEHGKCVLYGDHKLCSGCRTAFALGMGPGLKVLTLREKQEHHDHRDLAPAWAELLGLKLPQATGKAITVLR